MNQPAPPYFNPQNPAYFSMTGKPLHPFCKDCGWRKGGVDSWDGARCKCGHSSPSFTQLCGTWNATSDAIAKASGGTA